MVRECNHSCWCCCELSKRLSCYGDAADDGSIGSFNRNGGRDPSTNVESGQSGSIAGEIALTGKGPVSKEKNLSSIMRQIIADKSQAQEHVEADLLADEMELINDDKLATNKMLKAAGDVIGKPCFDVHSQDTRAPRSNTKVPVGDDSEPN
jgi:hypothetical protein